MGLLGVITLLAVATITAASDCTVCLNGRCHATSSFYDGHTKLGTGRMVIDNKNNVLYEYDNGINAINLNTNTKTSIAVSYNGNYLAFDHETGFLYYYKNNKDEELLIYEYQPLINRTSVATILNPEKKEGPLNLWLSNGVMYYNTHKESGCDVEYGLNMFRTYGVPPEGVSGFENIVPTNIVFNKLGNMYVSTGSRIYEYKPYQDVKLVLVAEGKYLLAGDKNGEIYLLDQTKRYIYKVDSSTHALTNIGAYDASRDGRMRPTPKEFMFDANNNLIIKDKWSTLYYKDFPARCSFQYDEGMGRTWITKL